MENIEKMENVEDVESLEVLDDADEKVDIEKMKRNQKIKDGFKAGFAYLFLTICAIFSFLPFYWMIISSLKTEYEYREVTPTFFPKEFKWENYSYILTQNNSIFGQSFVNTLIIGVVSTLLGVVVIILTAYAFARINFVGKDLLFTIMLATMMIPGELYTITNYVLTVGTFQLADTYTIMILPFLVSTYYIYLLRNTFKSIPESLYKAAKVDGCTDMKFLIRVMVPLAAPTLISIILLKFIATWNSYIWPQLVNGKEYYLISNWMTTSFMNDGVLYPKFSKTESLTTLRMAAACVVSMPLFVLFLFFRKYIMQGVSKSGTKG